MAERNMRALVALEGISPQDVQRVLPDTPGFQLVGLTNGVDETLRLMHDGHLDLVLVAAGGEGDHALQLIHDVHHAEPETPIVVMTTLTSNGFLRRAFESGAVDVIAFPQERSELAFAMSKALARRAGAAAASDAPEGRLICVLGPKGGTGKTLTTCNLAVGLAELGESVLVVDLDLQFGDVALCMGLPPDRSVHDLAVSAGTFDEEKLKAYVVAHNSGVDFLLAPSRPDYASSVTVDLLRDVFAVARTQYDVILVDTPPGFTAEVIATIDSSSDVVMVGMLDSLSLKNTKLGLETLTLMGYDDNRIKLVLNRAHSRVGISQSDVVAVLGREPDIFIPSDREIPRAVNEGVPIIVARPQSEPAAAFRQLAAVFAPDGVGPATETLTPARRRLFGRK